MVDRRNTQEEGDSFSTGTGERQGLQEEMTRNGQILLHREGGRLKTLPSYLVLLASARKTVGEMSPNGGSGNAQAYVSAWAPASEGGRAGGVAWQRPTSRMRAVRANQRRSRTGCWNFLEARRRPSRR